MLHSLVTVTVASITPWPCIVRVRDSILFTWDKSGQVSPMTSLWVWVIKTNNTISSEYPFTCLQLLLVFIKEIKSYTFHGLFMYSFLLSLTNSPWYCMYSRKWVSSTYLLKFVMSRKVNSTHAAPILSYKLLLQHEN